MIKKRTVRKLIFIIPYLILIILNIKFLTYSNILSIYTLLATIIFCIKYRKKQALFIIFLFVSSYSILPFFYFNFGTKISFYKEYANYYSFSNTLNCQSLLIAMIYLFLNSKDDDSNKIAKLIKVYSNNIIFYLNICIIVFIILFAKTGDNIFIVGGYGKVERSHIGETALWEYILIFILAAYIFSGKKQRKLIVILVLSFLFILKDMSMGGRIASVELLILVFILLFEMKFSNKVFKIMIILGFMLFALYGNFRGNINNKFEIFEYKALLANQGEVYYSSTLLISLVEEGIIGIFIRLKSFVGNIISLFLPSRFIYYEADIIWMASDKLGGCGGGGLISSYFYLWTGYVGIVFVGKYLAFIIDNLYKKTNKYMKVYSVLVLSTIPRWYAYKPLALFKLSFYIIPVLFIYLILYKTIRIYRSNNSLTSKGCILNE